MRRLLSDGESISVTSAKSLLAVLSRVIAVVRPDADALADELRSVGCKVSMAADARLGMAHSLTHALDRSSGAHGWIVALADMPWVKSSTIAALAKALDDGATIAAPVFEGRRGNPVGFSSAHLAELLALRGDEGARRLLQQYSVKEIKVDDPGILRDVDTSFDLPITPLPPLSSSPTYLHE